MLQRKVLLALVAAVAVGVLWIGQVNSQQQDPPAGQRQPGTRRQRDPEEFRRRMEEWRRRSDERLREQLEVSEEEWKKVLKPRIEEVQTLLRQSRVGMRGMMGRFGRRGGRAGRQARQVQGEREQTDIAKKTEALRTLLENKDAKTGAIKSALRDLQKARANASKKLAKARDKLREVVTARQEAHLVLWGLLD